MRKIARKEEESKIQKNESRIKSSGRRIRRKRRDEEEYKKKRW
jgi:hypothetical protein